MHRAAAVGAIVAIGLLLRLAGIRHGLPDFYEEAIPFRRAFDMWGWTSGRLDLNPHLFHYSSLTFYLQFAVQALHLAAGRLFGTFSAPADYHLQFMIDPMAMVVLGRMVGVLADAATIAGIARIGERLRPGAGLAAASLVACSPIMLLTSRAIFADTVMTAFSVWAIERLMAWERDGGRGRLASAAVLIGLATGAKYPAALLVAPLAVAAVLRHGRRGLISAAVGAATAFIAFLATSPYVLLDFDTFRRDFAFLGTLSSQGHLGSLGGMGLGFHAGNLVADLGWPALALAAASLGVVFARAPERRAWSTPWLALLAMAAPIALAHIQAQRYLVPVIPWVALLAALATIALARAAPARARGAATAALMALLLAPGALGGARASVRGADDTRQQARRWCEQHLGDRLLLQEQHGVVLPTLPGTLAVIGTPAFGGAAADRRRRFRERRVYRAVELPLVVSGRASAGVPGPGGGAVTLEIVPHAVDLNRLFYEPRLLQAVDYVMTSDAVRARFTADTVRFAAEARFYRAIDRYGTPVAEFRGDRRNAGPDLRIHRFDAAARAAVGAGEGALDPMWWTARIPRSFRLAADTLLARGRAPSEAPLDPDGRPAPWVQLLAPLFADKLAAFVHQLTLHTTELARCDVARALAATTLVMAPDDLSAALMSVTCAREQGRLDEAIASAGRTIAAAGASGRFARADVDLLRITQAELLLQAGASEAARAILAGVAAGSAPGSENAERARALLGAPAGQAP